MAGLSTSNPLAQIGVSTDVLASLPPPEALQVLRAAYRALQHITHPDKSEVLSSTSERLVKGESAESASGSVGTRSEGRKGGRLSPETLSKIGEVLKDEQGSLELLAYLTRPTPLGAEIRASRKALRAVELNRVAYEKAIGSFSKAAVHQEIAALRGRTLSLLDVDRALNQGAGMSLYAQLEVLDERRAKITRELTFSIKIQDSANFEIQGTQSFSIGSSDKRLLIGALHTSSLETLLDRVGLSEKVDRRVLPQNVPGYGGRVSASERRYFVSRVPRDRFSPLLNFLSPSLHAPGDRGAYLVACVVPRGEWEHRFYQILGRFLGEKEVGC